MATEAEQQRNLKLAASGLQAWVSGDTDDTLARFTDDVEIYVPAELGNAGTYRGKDEFLEWNRRWDDAWADFSHEVLDLKPVGDRHVVVTVRNRGRGAGSGIEVEAVQGWVLGVRGDLCDFISLQASTEAAVELARERESE